MSSGLKRGGTGLEGISRSVEGEALLCLLRQMFVLCRRVVFPRIEVRHRALCGLCVNPQKAPLSLKKHKAEYANLASDLGYPSDSISEGVDFDRILLCLTSWLKVLFTSRQTNSPAGEVKVVLSALAAVTCPNTHRPVNDE